MHTYLGPYQLDQTYEADYLTFLSRLPAESVDLVLTDPAYESLTKWQGMGTTARMGLGRAGSASADPKKFFPTIPNSQLPTLLKEVYRVLKNERHAYIMCDFETLLVLLSVLLGEERSFVPTRQGGRLCNPFKPLIWSPDEEEGDPVEAMLEAASDWLACYTAAIRAGEVTDPAYPELARSLFELIASQWSNKGLPLGDPMIWDKICSGMGYTYRSTHEYILMLWKGKKRRLNNLGTQDVFRFKRVPPHRAKVPTQKPVELFEVLVSQSTQPGETVLDMFMGAGTTAEACLKLGRYWLGCDLDPSHVEIANRLAYRLDLPLKNLYPAQLRHVL